MAPPRVACASIPQPPHYRVTLYASLAVTGKSHLTDRAIEEAIATRSLEIQWKADQRPSLHHRPPLKDKVMAICRRFDHLPFCLDRLPVEYPLTTSVKHRINQTGSEKGFRQTEYGANP